MLQRRTPTWRQRTRFLPCAPHTDAISTVSELFPCQGHPETVPDVAHHIRIPPPTRPRPVAAHNAAVRVSHSQGGHPPRGHTGPGCPATPPHPRPGALSPGLQRELPPSSTALRCTARWSQMFRGQPPPWVTGRDYRCQPHIRRALNGSEPPAPAAYNSAFVRCFAGLLFPASPTYVRAALAWGEKRRRQEDHSAWLVRPILGRRDVL